MENKETTDKKRCAVEEETWEFKWMFIGIIIVSTLYLMSQYNTYKAVDSVEEKKIRQAELLVKMAFMMEDTTGTENVSDYYLKNSHFDKNGVFYTCVRDSGNAPLGDAYAEVILDKLGKVQVIRISYCE